MGKISTSLRRSMSSIIERDEYPYPVWKEKLIDIKDWIHCKFVETPRRYYQAVKRVIEWTSVVWMNYDWDFHYFFKIMQYKLERMEKTIRFNGNASNSQKTADQIKVAKLLLDRICDRDYSDNSVLLLDEEYGGWEFEFSSSKITKKYNRELTKSQIDCYERAIKKAYKHADYMEKQDVEYLFSYIRKHYSSWWD